MTFDLASAKPVSGGFDLSSAKPIGPQDEPVQSAPMKDRLYRSANELFRSPSVMDAPVDATNSKLAAIRSGIRFDENGYSSVNTRAQDIAAERAVAPKADGQNDTMAETSRFIQGSGSPRIADQEAVTRKPEVVMADAVEASGRAEQERIDAENARMASLRTLAASDTPEGENARRILTEQGAQYAQGVEQRNYANAHHVIADTATDFRIGVAKVPGAFTGLLDIAPALVVGERPADKLFDEVGRVTGFQPAKYAQELEAGYSDIRKQGQNNITAVWNDETKDWWDVTKEYAANLGVTAGNIIQSLPSMAAGGAIGRVAMLSKAGLAPAAMQKAATTAGAIGEGAIMAGQQMNEIDKSVDARTAALASLATGIMGAAVGKYSGALASKFGIRDVDTMLAGGTATSAVTSPFYKRIPAAMMQEGIIEEGTQSSMEQMLKNIAEDKPVMEGVNRATVEGIMAGSVMGGAVAAPGMARPANPETKTDYDAVLATLAKAKELADAQRTASDRVQGGFDLASAQPVADAKPTAQSATAPITAPATPLQESAPSIQAARKPRASSDLLQRIKQLGGVDAGAMFDITGEKDRKQLGGWRFAFKNDGRGLDDLATSLADEGFAIDTHSVDGGVQQLKDMIRAHIGGERNFKASTIEKFAEQQAKDRYSNDRISHAESLGIKWKNLSETQLDEAIYLAEDALRMAEIAEREALSDEHVGYASGIADLLDEGTDIPFGDDLRTDDAALAVFLGEQYGENDKRGGGNPAESAGERAQEGAKSGARAASEAPGFALQSQTEAELKAQDLQRKQAAEERARREAAPSPEEFTLTGSDRAADVGAAHGQQDLLATQTDTGREGYDTKIEVDARALRNAFESDNGEQLAWSQDKLDAVRSGKKSTGNIEVAINAKGKIGVNDGRHRIAAAADNGERVSIFTSKDDAEKITARISAAETSSNQAGNVKPFSEVRRYLESNVFGKEKGQQVPDATFSVGTLPQSTIDDLSQFIDGFSEKHALVRVSGKSLKHTDEQRHAELDSVIDSLPKIIEGKAEVLHNPTRENSAFIVYETDKNYLVVLEISKNGNGTDVVNIITTRDRGLKQYRNKSAEWLDGRRTHHPVNHEVPAEGEISVFQPSGRNNIPQPAEQSKQSAKAAIISSDLDKAAKLKAIEALNTDTLSPEDVREVLGSTTQTTDTAMFQTGSPVVEPLAAKDFDEAVHRLSAGWDAVSRNRIVTIDDHANIPADILAAAEELGYPPNEIKGFVYQGNAYLVRPNIGTVAEVEETLVHEALGHLGTFAVLGKAAVPVMNEFWQRAGGTAGVLKIARQYGIEKEISAVTDAVIGLEKTALAKKRAAIVNELIAHAQTTGETAKAIKWVLGKIKQALQVFAERHNWNWLADKLDGFTDLDLAVFMKQARDAIVTGVTPEGTEVSFVADPAFSVMRRNSRNANDSGGRDAAYKVVQATDSEAWGSGVEWHHMAGHSSGRPLLGFFPENEAERAKVDALEEQVKTRLAAEKSARESAELESAPEGAKKVDFGKKRDPLKAALEYKSGVLFFNARLRGKAGTYDWKDGKFGRFFNTFGERDGTLIVRDDGTFEITEGSGAALFSRGNPGGGQTVESVTKATARLRNGWHGFRDIKIIETARQVPNDLYLRSLRALKPIDQGTEGVYDPVTNTVYLIASNIATPERAVWVAVHEVVGHGGIRMLGRSVKDTVETAAKNSTVTRLARAIAADRKEPLNARKHVDEAIAELAAAHITGDFDALLDRYQVVVPAEMRGGLRALIQRVVDALRSFMRAALGKPGEQADEVSDAEILDLIRQMKGKVEGKAEPAVEHEDGSYAMSSRAPAPKEGPAVPRNTDIVARILPKSVPLLYSRDELGNIRSELLGTRRFKDFLHAAFFRPMGVKLGMAQATPELAKLIRRQKADLDKAMRVAGEVVNSTKGMTEEEAGLISRIVTQEMRNDDVPPEHALKIAAVVEQAMTQQGQDAVDLKMLSEDAYEKWKGRYLPRFYLRHLDPEIKSVWRRAFKSSPVDGFRSGSLKGRGKRQVVTAAELPQWEALGWKLDDKRILRSGNLELTLDGKPLPDTDTVVIWKDYTPEERRDMGEIEDFRLRFVMGYLSMQRDLSVGRLYKTIAENPEWTRRTPSDGFVYVPETEIPDTGGLKSYGMLSGMYVRKEILYHISQYEQNNNEFQKYYKAALSKWKEGKTVLNPVTHMNNFVSNLTMAHFAGVSYWDGEKYYFALRDLARGDQLVKEAEDAGLFTGDFSQEEIMKGMPPEVRNLISASSDSAARRAGRFIWKLASLGLNEKAAKAYHLGDTLFKYAIYRDARSKGMSPEDAVQYSTKYIFNYDDLPVTARVIRDYALPFFGYTYKVVPALIHTAVEYPWRFAMPATIIASINALTYASLAGDSGDDDWWLTAIASGTINALLNAYTLGLYGDGEAETAGQMLEQEERKNLPEWDKGRSALGTQKTIRLGTDEKTGMPVFMNVYRFIPGGDIQDVNNEKGGIGGIPAPLMPSNPLLGLYSGLIDNRNWDGKELFDSNDTGTDKAKKAAGFIYKQFMPAVAPMGNHYDRILNSAANYFDTTLEKASLFRDYTGTGKDGLPEQPKYAAMQTFGIKAKPIDLQRSEEIAEGMKMGVAKSVKAEIRSAARLLEKGAISQREYDRIEREGMEKIEALMQTE
jgi:hypothetical protein